MDEQIVIADAIAKVAYGLSIQISEDSLKMMKEFAKIKAGRKVDVHMEVLGKHYEYTFE